MMDRMVVMVVDTDGRAERVHSAGRVAQGSRVGGGTRAGAAVIRRTFFQQNALNVLPHLAESNQIKSKGNFIYSFEFLLTFSS